MGQLRRISVILLSVSGLISLLRGYRMIVYTGTESILFPYKEEALSMSLFSNYNLFGWIIFILLGVFSLLTVFCIMRRTGIYSYLIMAEGIFQCFFVLTHMLYNGFSAIHILILPWSIATITLGILQTPREFVTGKEKL